MVTPTINIDMDKACSKCGHMGACGNGLCMECSGKLMTEKAKWKIGEKTIKACISIIQSYLWQKQSEINRAYVLMPGEISIGLSLKILPDSGINQVKGGINFTIEKCKEDCAPVFVDEDQMDLEFGEE